MFCRLRKAKRGKETGINIDGFTLASTCVGAQGTFFQDGPLANLACKTCPYSLSSTPTCWFRRDMTNVGWKSMDGPEVGKRETTPQHIVQGWICLAESGVLSDLLRRFSLSLFTIFILDPPHCSSFTTMDATADGLWDAYCSRFEGRAFPARVSLHAWVRGCER